jgi:hypothetical protein
MMTGSRKSSCNLSILFMFHYVSAGLYRDFRLVCEGRSTLLARIGGPDTGQVSQEPGVLARAAAQGLSRNSEGEVQGFSS